MYNIFGVIYEPENYEQGEDGNLLVNKSTFKCLVYDDVKDDEVIEPLYFTSQTDYATITLTLLFTAIVMALTINFNVQKAAIISVTVLPIIVVMIINILGLYDNQYNNLEKILWNTRFIYPVIAIIAYVLSFYMSYRIYLKKEYH